MASPARANIRAPSRAVGDALRVHAARAAQEGKSPEEVIVVMFPVVVIDRGVSKPVPHSRAHPGRWGRG